VARVTIKAAFSQIGEVTREHRRHFSRQAESALIPGSIMVLRQLDGIIIAVASHEALIRLSRLDCQAKQGIYRVRIAAKKHSSGLVLSFIELCQQHLTL
jgi:hypothetical protein